MGHPLEDVSVCGVLRCVWGVCERHGYVVCCLVVLGLPFWPFSGSELMLLGVGVVLSHSGRNHLGRDQQRGHRDTHTPHITHTHYLLTH